MLLGLIMIVANCQWLISEAACLPNVHGKISPRMEEQSSCPRHYGFLKVLVSELLIFYLSKPHPADSEPSIHLQNLGQASGLSNLQLCRHVIPHLLAAVLGLISSNPGGGEGSM
jgi:hypothetical protein